MPVRLLLDENLRGRSLWKAISTRLITYSLDPASITRVGDAGAPALSTRDDDLLAWAAANHLPIITTDMSTLVPSHGAILVQGRSTSGLVVVKRGYPVGQIAEEIVLISFCMEYEECASQTLYIPEFPRTEAS